MNKFFLFAFGCAMLLGGCAQDREVNSANEVKDLTELNTSPELLSGNGISGIAYVKVSENLAAQMAKMAQSDISMNSIPSTMAATLSKINTTDIKPLFPIDPRFEERMRREGLDRWFIVRFDEKQDLNTCIATLAANSEFDVVEKSYEIEYDKDYTPFAVAPPQPIQTDENLPFDDPQLILQWHYKNFGKYPKSVAGADINLFEAWKTTTGTPNVIVSVVDGGVDYEHEDLKDNIWINTKEIPGNGIDDDGNGYIDDITGFNFTNNTGVVEPDNYSHGTHVAGTVAARNNNGIGVCGVAGGDGSAGSGVRLMSCQIFGAGGGGGGVDSDAAAIVYGANNGAVISQNSWGFRYPGPGYLPENLKVAIDYFIKYAGCDNKGNQLKDSPMKGGIVMFAAGNDDKDFLSYPAAYEKVIAVTAMAPNWKKAWYSNFGTWADIMAPGGDQYFAKGQVLSTVSPKVKEFAGKKYAYMQGTSMACPHVSGIAALAVSHFGKQGFTNEDLKKRLLTSLRPKDINAENPKYKGRLGAGYIDAGLVFAINQNKHPEDVKDIVAEIDYVEMTLTWSAVKDEDDGKPVIYRLYFSDKEFTAENHLAVPFVDINGFGFEVGEKISHKLKDLTDDTDYYAGVIAIDRWGLESKMHVKKFKTKKNNPPVATGLPTEEIAISGADTYKFALNISDPDSHKWTYKISGENRGVSVYRIDDKLEFTIRAIAPIGKYKIILELTDELGASVKIDIPFEVYLYEPPTLKEPIKSTILGIDQGALQFDLTKHFTYQKRRKVTFTASSSDAGVMTASIKDDSKLEIKGLKTGVSVVRVSISDGISDPVETQFEVRVVPNINDPVYMVYPIPTRDKLNILVNPAMNSANFEVRTLRGELVLNKNYNVGISSLVVLNVKKLSAGTYVLYVSGDKGSYKKTFVKL
ncbi:S8 family serine peptidase [Porphyromonas macacae]|uniref:Thermophilic serine proteinase n=1 Tax=Porphyromonas macacae TaxID=28115 RepID=A0A379DIA9_9PORP|nr:S8 family serine peptidase [Porphyromonas macacae]SUB77465.1 Thermophilic serine proteinase precursor [Porphyromonas macacae]